MKRRLPGNPKLFWPALRQELNLFFSDRLAGVEDSGALIAQLVNQFDAELRSMCTVFQTKVNYTKKTRSPKTERSHLVAACHVLAMDPPKLGQRIDMARAKRQKNRFVRMYHPDVNQGSEQKRDQYESVIQAWRILEEYEAGFNGQQSQTAEGDNNG